MNPIAHLIELEHVEKHYGRERVVAIESLALDFGERVVITGLNGSGKSTLLRLLAGVSQPNRGLVRRNPALDQASLGYVPQSGGLYTELSIRANLAQRRRLWNLPETAPESAWYVQDLGLEPLLDKTPAELSGGFQRLAAVATALHVEPSWLLLDEPFYGLDKGRRDILEERLRHLCNNLVLFVVTAPSVEFTDAARVVRMENGRVL